jgi:hypothetical protein
VHSKTDPKVLLTSVCRPFGGPGEGDSVGAELFHAQVTRAQGISASGKSSAVKRSTISRRTSTLRVSFFTIRRSASSFVS